MNGLIRASIFNPRAITVLMLTLVLLGAFTLAMIPVDILPQYRSPAVQVLTFYGGMSATQVEKGISSRIERWTGQAAGVGTQESRSIVGASVVRNYFRDGVDPAAALGQTGSLASAAQPTLPPGTLPPIILPFDPTATVPVAIIAINNKAVDPNRDLGKEEANLTDIGRFQVRSMVMSSKGANAPVVYGGRARAVLAYLDREKLQARGLSPMDVMTAIERNNVFLPSGSLKIGGQDLALDSNSMYELVDRMRDIPIRTDKGSTVYLGDVASPQDASLIQTNIVRVDGKRRVYVPVYRQSGYSTLDVVDNLKAQIPEIKKKLDLPEGKWDIDLNVVMDQSVYVRQAIESLMEEGVLGAILCSVVILLFLGDWRMTVIAALTIPIAVLASIAGLFATGNSINVMTLAGLALAIGPLVDIAIIGLENTHRHLGIGAAPRAAAFRGSSEVVMPSLVATLCTFLVLAPLALMPGMGAFLFRPMTFAVGFAMVAAFFMSATFVPSRCAYWLKGHAPRDPHPPIVANDYEHRDHHENPRPRSALGRLFEAWEGILDGIFRGYGRLLGHVMQMRELTVVAAFGLLLVVLILFGPQLRREFFPEVDAGAFEIGVRTTTGTQLEMTEQKVASVEEDIKAELGPDLELVISEIGVTPDWSAAYTQNSGPMDAMVKVQLKPDRAHSAQYHVAKLREKLLSDHRLTGVEFSFDAGGMIRAAMNEGKSSPITVRITAKDLPKARRLAEKIQRDVVQIPGVVDARILQRLNYPQYVIKVDRAKAAALGLTQVDVMTNVVAALNSSIQFNKKNFWIDPKNYMIYYVGVQYPEGEITSLETLRNVPITSPKQGSPIPLRTVADIIPSVAPAEATHFNLQATIDLTMGVEGRDMGHTADDIAAVLAGYGKPRKDGGWTPNDPDSEGKLMEGSRMTLAGEYAKMNETFTSLGLGLIGASVLIYFLMVALFKSYMTPLVVISAVPCGLIGVVLMLFVTGTALNVQSLLGVIFMVGIVVSNTVLIVDFAQNLRRQEGMDSTEAIRRAAAIRVRPVCMTALATFFALIPMALGLAKGSEANVPLGRAVLGGLLAGLATTLLVVPCLYSLLVRGPVSRREDAPIVPEDEVASAGGEADI